MVELEAVSKHRLEAANAQIERKAKIYEKLKRGDTSGLTDKQRESLLVDVSMLFDHQCLNPT